LRTVAGPRLAISNVRRVGANVVMNYQ